MRKTILLLLSFVFVYALSAQSCLPDGITFTTQEQIYSFANDYPSCSEILGDVLIDEEIYGRIKELHGLLGLKSIGGSLKIKNNAELRTLSGLDSLRHVNGNLFIKNNKTLHSLEHLQNLDSIAGLLAVAYNNSLTSLYGLHNIAAQSIAASSPFTPDIAIHHNPLLTECDMQSICETLKVPETRANIRENFFQCDSREEVQQSCLSVFLQTYPNPVHETLTILSPTKQTAHLYNATGTLIQEIKLIKGQNEIHFAHLPKGLYLLKTEKEEVVKLIKF